MNTIKHPKSLHCLHRRPLAACLVALCAWSNGQAQVFTVPVLNCDDHGNNSLRDAVTSSSSGDVIDMTQLACSTISLTTGAIVIAHAISDLTMVGPANRTLTVTGDNLDRVFLHAGEGTLTLDHMTITDGAYLGGTAGGGCIYSFGSVALQNSSVSNCTLSLFSSKAEGGAIFAKANLTLNDSVLSGNQALSAGYSVLGGAAYVKGDLVANRSSIRNNRLFASTASSWSALYVLGNAQLYATTISGNQAKFAAGIIAGGSLTISNSTISGNRANALYGGIFAGGSLTLDNSTVAFNNHGSNAPGAGIHVNSGAVVNSSIVANNTSFLNGSEYDLDADFGPITGSHNLIGTANIALPPGTLGGNPRLGPLADNGGPTFTHALKSGSPAIHNGIDLHGFAFDQRQAGHPRIIGAGADIGAFELNTSDVIFTDGFD